MSDFIPDWAFGPLVTNAEAREERVEYEWPEHLRIKPEYWLTTGGSWVVLGVDETPETRAWATTAIERTISIRRARTALIVTERLDPEETA